MKQVLSQQKNRQELHKAYWIACKGFIVTMPSSIVPGNEYVIG